MNIDVNYKNKRRTNLAKYPIRQPLFFVGLIWLLSKMLLIGKKYKIEKINMEGLKPPYIILSNHMYFVDFELAAMGTFPHRVNNVVHIDGYYRRTWLMDLIGTVGTRKFTSDFNLVKSIKEVLRRGDILCMYPEARYSACGVTSYIPDSVGALVKRSKVPVVAILHRGNHLLTPFWNFRKPRKVPLHTTLTQILTAEDVERMSTAEINAVIKEALTYDDYKYQKENGIIIDEPYRAEGIHKILYKCPHCKTERNMGSEGAEVFCRECGKRWTLNTDGTLSANEGETEFSHVPDWYEWERQEVIAEVERGEYSFSDEVDVYSEPRGFNFVHLGKAKVTHDAENGFILEGEYRGEKYRVHRAPHENNSLHIEYDYCYLKPLDCFEISTNNDSFTCYPETERDIVTKMGFATEAIYAMQERKRLEKRKKKDLRQGEDQVEN